MLSVVGGSGVRGGEFVPSRLHFLEYALLGGVWGFYVLTR